MPAAFIRKLTRTGSAIWRWTLQLTVKEARGAVILELVKGGHQFRCQIDLGPGENQGRAEFTISGLPDFKHSVQTAIRGPGNIRRELRQCR